MASLLELLLDDLLLELPKSRRAAFVTLEVDFSELFRGLASAFEGDAFALADEVASSSGYAGSIDDFNCLLLEVGSGIRFTIQSAILPRVLRASLLPLVVEGGLEADVAAFFNSLPVTILSVVPEEEEDLDGPDLDEEVEAALLVPS